MPYFLLGSQLLGNLDNTWREVQAKGGVGSGNGTGKVINLEKESFNMGNLDFLWFMLNQLAKLEAQMESNLKKIDRQVIELDPNHKGFMIETREEGKKTPETFLFTFKWDDSKYPRNSIPDTYKNLEHKLKIIEGDLRNKTQAFQDKKTALGQLQKKEGGNLNTKDLSEILKKPVVEDRDFVYTDFLTTAIAVVPRTSIENWEANYERWNDYIVPQSTKRFKVDEGDGFSLWRVVLFRKSLEEFQNYCRSTQKIIVREFNYDKNEIQEKERLKGELKAETDKMTKTLLELCDRYFSDLYSAYIHLKVLKLLIDCVLRYGVKDKIFTCVIKPAEGKERKIHQGLTKIFAEPGQMQMYGAKEEIDDTEDFFPYSSVPINIP